MLINLRKSFDKSSTPLRLLIILLVVLLIAPNILGFFSSSSHDSSVVVATSSKRSVEINELQALYPQKLNEVIRNASANPQYSRYLLEKMLQDLSIKDYIEQHQLLPSREFIWQELRKQAAESIRRSATDDKTVGIDEIDLKINEMLPQDAVKRNEAINGFRHQYAVSQLGQALFDMGLPIAVSGDYAYVYNQHLINEYNISNSFFINSIDLSNAEELAGYFDEHQNKYHTDPTYNVAYQRVKINVQDLLDYYGVTTLKEELAVYDRTDTTEDDVADYATAKFLSSLETYIEGLNSEHNVSDLPSAMNTLISSAIKDKDVLDSYTESQISSFFGDASSKLIKSFHGATTPYIVLLHNSGEYYLAKIEAFNAAKNLSFDEALSQVKEDFIYDRTDMLSKNKLNDLALALKRGLVIDLSDEQWSGLTVTDRKVSLKDKFDALNKADPLEKERHELGNKSQLYTLTHPSFDNESFFDIIHDPVTGTHCLIAYSPDKEISESIETSSTSEVDFTALEDGLDQWLKNTHTQNFINYFVQLTNRDYQFVIDDAFMLKIQSYSQDEGR